MATKPINNSGIMNSLSTVAAQDAAKAKDASAIQNKAAASVANDPAKANFDVNISTSARDRAEASAKALEIARKTPDVREDRVAMLKKQIDEGNYKVDSGKIADGMMREAILDHLAETDER
jgi:flagellar biosynthesis anti-sigma factor FlgM